MARRKRKPIQTISIVFSVLLFSGTMLAQLVQRLPATEPPVDVSSSPLVHRVTTRHPLRLNQTQTLTFEHGDVVALTYQGEADDVITLRVIPDDDIIPRLLVYVGDSDIPVYVVDDAQQAFVCGLALESTDTYQFVFGANDSDYVIELESGDTCESE